MGARSVEQVTAYSGEMMLLGWGETHNRGRTVTFLLPEEGDEHPFRHLTVKNGKVGGQRFMAVLVQVDESERPVKQPAKSNLAQVAAMMGRDKDFWLWINDTQIGHSASSEAQARDYILDSCAISSRADLDKSGAAAFLFEEIRSEFGAWAKTKNTPKL